MRFKVSKNMEDKDILQRIDDVLKENKNLQWCFVVLTVGLFLCGIFAISLAIYKQEFVWTIPSVFTTLFLKWPIENIIKIRDKNIALATVPALVTKLSPEDTTKEIQKLIEKLYESK